VTLDRLKGAAEAIVLQFVVAAHDPGLTLVFHPDLRGANDVACREKTKVYTVEGKGFVPANALVMIGAKALLQDGKGMVMSEVIFAAPPGMVAVSMRNNGAVHAPPGVNVKITGSTIEAFIGKLDQRHGCVYARNMPAKGKLAAEFKSLQVCRFQCSRGSLFVHFDF
jgi:hypothetical protein